MPQLLVSVRDAREAAEALAGGAEWIDLKEPRRGALGPVDAAVARNVVAAVGAKAPVSAAAGELVDWPGARSRDLLGIAGVSLVKLGLAGCRAVDWKPAWRRAQREIADAQKQLVAVAYADHEAARSPRPTAIIRAAARSSVMWLLIDTFDKTGPSLLELMPTAALAAFFHTARRAGLRTVVAGRLDGDAIRQLPWDAADVAAVRGAACRGGREGQVCRARVAKLMHALASSGPDATVALPSRGVQ